MNNITGIMWGVVGTIIAAVILYFVVQIVRRLKVTDEEVRDILSDYEDQLLVIAELVLDILKTDKSLPEGEYEDKILELTATYFRDFLEQETMVPEFIIAAITPEHMYDIIDYINTISSRNLEDIDEEPPIGVDPSVFEESIEADHIAGEMTGPDQTDISEDLTNTIYDLDSNDFL